jgi:hypothetical protein
LRKADDQECPFPCIFLKELGHFYSITDILSERLRQIP